MRCETPWPFTEPVHLEAKGRRPTRRERPPHRQEVLPASHVLFLAASSRSPRLAGDGFPLWLGNKIAADSISNLYAMRGMSLVTGAQLEMDKESSHDREGIPLQRVGDR